MELRLDVVAEGDEPVPHSHPAAPKSTRRRALLRVAALLCVVAAGTFALVTLGSGGPANLDVRLSTPGDNLDPEADIVETAQPEPASVGMVGVSPGDVFAPDVEIRLEARSSEPADVVTLLLGGVIVMSNFDAPVIVWLSEPGIHDVVLRVDLASGETIDTDPVRITVEDRRIAETEEPTTTSVAAEAATEATPTAEPALLSSTDFAISVSTFLPSTESGLSYGATNLTDNDPATAWNHDSGRAPAAGQWVRLDFAVPESVVAIEILNGYQKSLDVWAKNHRARELRVEIVRTNSTDTMSAVLEDSFDAQIVEIPEGEPVISLTLVVESIYSGSRWDDLALTEIDVIALR